MTSMESFEQAEQNFSEFFATTSAVLAAILVLAGVGLDYAFYPERVTEFFALRVILCAAFAVVAILVARRFGLGKVSTATLWWVFAVQAMICWMIYRTEGEGSVYFVGLALAISALGLFLVITTMNALLFIAGTVGLYIMACLLREGGVDNVPAFLGQVLFLTFYGLIAILGVNLSNEWRKNSYLMKVELHRQANEIRDQHLSLQQMQGSLIRSEKMAAIGTLVSGILHEVSNPLNYSSLAVNLAREEPKNSPRYAEMVDENLADAQEGLARIRGIVDDLKKYSYQRSEVDTQEIARLQFCLVKCIKVACRLASFDLGSIPIDIRVPKTMFSIGDESAITSVFINLLSNAAHAIRSARKDGGLIEIVASEQSDRVELTVRDNGAGIPPELIGKVLEPFFTTRESGVGLGLGLSLSQSVVARHGGSLSVLSEPGAWTEFRFDLPLAVAELPA